MTTERRLAKLEQSLTPVQAVLRWLDAARAFGSLDDYLAATFAESDAAPLDDVIGSVEGGIRESMRGQPRDAIETAVRTAARQAAFRYLLAIRLNVAAGEQASEKGLMAACLFFWMRTLATDEFMHAKFDSQAGGQQAAWDTWRATVVALLGKVYAEEEARASLEREYLDGRPCLFPDVERTWTETREQAERVARLGLFLQRVGDAEPLISIAEIDLGPVRAGATTMAAERAAYLADVVRANTWHLSGDDRRAARILVPRFGRSAVSDKTPTL